MFSIEFLAEADEDLQQLRRYDQELVVTAIDGQLSHEPDRPTRNRKRLRPNQLAEWDLRVGEFRVFYDVNTVNSRVTVAAIGQKQGGKLFVHGEEYDL